MIEIEKPTIKTEVEGNYGKFTVEYKLHSEVTAVFFVLVHE